MFLLRNWATLLSVVILNANSHPIGSKGIKNTDVFFTYDDGTESGESKENIEEDSTNGSREEALNVNYNPSRRMADVVSFLSLEPKAEMLPINYKNVVPPGVDHMEIKNNPTNASYDSRLIHRSNKPVKIYHEPTLVEIIENQKRKIKPVDAVVKGKYVQDVVRDGTGNYPTGNVQERKGIYERDRQDEEDDAPSQKDHNGMSYRNVYHQDQYKKDADFYDKRNPVGKYRKHVQYNEERPIRVEVFAKTTTQSSSSEV